MDEILRKIGRNVLLLQQLEQILKWTVPRLTVSGNTSVDIKRNFEKREIQCLSGHCG